jgi:WD40-like Beta Propeller Repeat
MRPSAEIGAPVVLAVDAGAASVVSPNGSKFVFRASETGPNQIPRLYVRPRDQLQATPLAGTEGARDQFFSPDGQWIGFFSDGKLKKIPTQGGTPVTLGNTLRSYRIEMVQREAFIGCAPMVPAAWSG